ncbi:GNAT family N-acetyltransferase [Insolitispirillum peregrinum]|uniref:GNAT family N-acetyltransferase n=1 Tax=Insolitispirillum peregrinum TaxID=80876 RepID=UPI003620E452
MRAFHIRPARDTQDMASARRLFRDYQGYLNVDLCFQGFETELNTLPGDYAPPVGELLLAWETEDRGEGLFLAGGVAVRPLYQKEATERVLVPGACEMKRLYVYPQYHGQGIGGRLAHQIIACARQLGYQRMVLDTLERLDEAVALYQRFGFQECAPYYDNPIPGVIYMELDLTAV